MPQSAGYIRYVFVALTLQAKWATMLAPQQTIMRASAILRCEGAAAKLDCIWILNTLPFRGLRCANMQRRPEAKHCSSLCLQSEGDEYCGSQTRLKIQQSHAPERWPYSLRVRGPHFASKVSYNAGAATDDCAGQRKSPLRGRWCLFTDLDFLGFWTP